MIDTRICNGKEQGLDENGTRWSLGSYSESTPWKEAANTQELIGKRRMELRFVLSKNQFQDCRKVPPPNTTTRKALWSFCPSAAWRTWDEGGQCILPV